MSSYTLLCPVQVSIFCRPQPLKSIVSLAPSLEVNSCCGGGGTFMCSLCGGFGMGLCLNGTFGQRIGECYCSPIGVNAFN